ncbi:MAG: hypothetical protein HN348_15045 [Proteobacteria bacterium]|nr:hypothetical protein [Pseudomonadota bacterium]
MKLVASILFLLMSTANADRWEAETCLRAKVWDGYAEGYGVRSITSTDLIGNESRQYAVTLYGGTEYRFNTCGDKWISDLDLMLFDQDRVLIQRDETQDREPEIIFVPDKTRVYYLMLQIRKLKHKTDQAAVALSVSYQMEPLIAQANN